MKILLTNDDGWDAPGLAALKEVANQFGEVWTVAPLHPMSGISHQITFERPLKLAQTAPQSWSLDGTPADCVRIATTQLSVDFDWVFSGINNGGNLGTDIFVSGTVAAAREATLRGFRAIALSQHRNRFKLQYDWKHTRWMAAAVLMQVVNQEDWEPHTLCNVNFPDKFHRSKDSAETEFFFSSQEELMNQLNVVWCQSDRHPIPSDFQIEEDGSFLYCSKYNERARSPDSDIANCFAGSITLSTLRI